MMSRDEKMALIFMGVWIIVMAIFLWCALVVFMWIYHASQALPEIFKEFEDIGGIL